MNPSTTNKKGLVEHHFDDKLAATPSPSDHSGAGLSHLTSFAAGLLSLLLWYIWRTDTEIFGWKVGDGGWSCAASMRSL
jgi:hypothetical protein